MLYNGLFDLSMNLLYKRTFKIIVPYGFMLILNSIIIICSLVILISIVAYTLMTGISPMPSSRKTVNAMLDLVPEGGPIADAGSGWGTLAIAAARRFPDRKVVGYELSPVPWFFSMVWRYLLGINNLELRRKNFLTADLAGISVLLCYLCPRCMDRLEKKLVDEGFPVRVVVSSTFAFPALKADHAFHVGDRYRTPMYVYRFEKSSLWV